MNRNLLPYHFTRAPRRLQRARMDNIAIVPASLLFQNSKVMKEAANRLTTGSVLLVPPPQNRQKRIFERVASYFRSSGHQVTTISVEMIVNKYAAVS